MCAFSGDPVKASGTILSPSPPSLGNAAVCMSYGGLPSEPNRRGNMRPPSRSSCSVRQPSRRRRPRPSIDDLINLKRVGSPAIRPNGRHVAFTIRETNWDDNAYETEIWIGDAATGQSRQVTNARKSSQQPAWSPDGAWLAFVSDRDGKRQIYRIALGGGEAERLTTTTKASAASRGRRRASRSRSRCRIRSPTRSRNATSAGARSGSKIRISATRTCTCSTSTTKTTRQLTKGSFVVGSFDWSPDGTQIAFDHRATSDPADGGTADISVVSVGDRRR